MPKPDLARCRRVLAWVTTDEAGEIVRHYKTIDEHGATVGEHIEGGYRGLRSWFKILGGRPVTAPGPVEEVFGTPSLTDECQEARERRKLRMDQ